MRVAFAVDNLNIGGTELNAVRTAEALRARGVDLHLITMQEDGPLRVRYERIKVPIHVMSPGSLYRPGALLTARAVLRLLDRLRPQVVHAHDIYSNAFFAPLARLAKVPLVIASRRWWYPPVLGYRMLNRWAYRTAHLVAANSDGVAQLLHEKENVPRERTWVFRNFLSPEAFEVPDDQTLANWRSELEIGTDQLVVGCVANLSPVKDHATLLRALTTVLPRTNQEVVVVLVGEGPERPALEQLARELGIRSKVRFAGARPNQPSFHWLFDVSVLASTSEGLPNSLVEAMAAAKPVVATRVGAVEDLVTEDTGRLVPPSEPKIFGEAILELLQRPELRQRLGAAGAERASTHHRRDSVIDELLDVYGWALGEVDALRSDFQH